MKGLSSLAVVVAFFVTIPQCLGQSQDAEKDAALLLTEQQLVQMFNLAMAPPTIASVPVMAPGCIKECNDLFSTQACKDEPTREAQKTCREDVRAARDNCTLCCHTDCSVRLGCDLEFLDQVPAKCSE